MIVGVENAGVVMDMRADETVSEQRHIVSAGRKARLMAAVPAEAHIGGVGIFLEDIGQVGQLALILKGDRDTERVCKFFSKTQIVSGYFSRAARKQPNILTIVSFAMPNNRSQNAGAHVGRV